MSPGIRDWFSMAAATNSPHFPVEAVPSKLFNPPPFYQVPVLPMPVPFFKKFPRLSIRISALSSAFNSKRFFKIEALVQEAPLSSQETANASEQEEQQQGQQTQETQLNPPPTNKLYVGNLPWSCDAAELTEIFQECGTVETVEVINEKETGRSRGFAFVTMTTLEGAQAAIEKLDGIEMGGRALRVSFPDKPRRPHPDRRSGEAYSGTYVDSPHKIYVGNLAWTVNSNSLREFFNENGNVLGAKVVYQTDTGGSCGYGFVSFSSQADAEAAIASFDGKELEGRPVNVKTARKTVKNRGLVFQ